MTINDEQRAKCMGAFSRDLPLLDVAIGRSGGGGHSRAGGSLEARVALRHGRPAAAAGGAPVEKGHRRAKPLPARIDGRCRRRDLPLSAQLSGWNNEPASSTRLFTSSIKEYCLQAPLLLCTIVTQGTRRMSCWCMFLNMALGKLLAE